MVLSYATRIPKKWRVILLALSVILVLGQIWVITNPSSSSTATVSLEEVDTTIDHQRPLTNSFKQEPIKKIQPPKKQSILLGFGGYLSKLPQLQHDFEKEPLAFTKLRERRRKAIKQSFMHGWSGYKKYAFGHDELKPLSNKSKDPFGGWGATMIDALSTLAVMELHEEFQSVLPRINKINFKVNDNISVFESIIRYLGGFISAYELSERKNDVLIQKAEKLAQELLPAFDTPSGLPHHYWNPVLKEPDNDRTLIAEVGTVQLEFMMLSQLTRNPIYGQKAQEITDFLDSMGYEHGLYVKGLYPTTLNTEEGRFLDTLSTFGAMGDSAFEYFLKEYLLVDGSVPQYGRMYQDSVKGMKRYMLRQVPGYDMLMLPPFDTQEMTHMNSMDHLTCFVPGMLAMGAKTFNEPEDMEIAKGLLETCVFMYRTTKTGLAPDSWVITKTEPYNPLTFNKTKLELSKSRDWWYEPDMTNPLIEDKMNTSSIKKEEEKLEYLMDYQLPPPRKRPSSLYFGDKRYILRPETLESLFVLYRLTGDQKYQEYGWEIYQAIEKWCKTKSAYAAVRNVDRDEDLYEDDKVPETSEFDPQFNQIDSMESFLFAETFKYLYLLFSPPDFISLDKFIFNTEAHPFIRKQWNWDRILAEKKA